MVGLVVTALIATAVWVWRAPLAERAAEAALARAGLADAKVSVVSLGPAAAVADLQVVGGPSGRVRVTYDLEEVWRERRVRSVLVTDAALGVTLNTDGVRVAGLGELPGGSGGGAMPFDCLLIEEAALTVETPGGTSRGTISARIDERERSARLVLMGDAGLAEVMAEDASLEADLAMRGGELAARLRLDGSLSAGARRADAVSLTAGFAATDWAGGDPRAASGTGEIVITSAETTVGGEALSVSGRSALSLDDGVLRAAPTVAVRWSEGSVATGPGATASFDVADGALSASLPLTFDVPMAAGTATVAVLKARGAAVTFEGDVLATRAAIAGASLGASSWRGTGSAGPGRLSATGALTAFVDRFEAGPLSVVGTTVSGPVEAIVEAGVLTVAAPDCLTARRAEASIAEMGLSLSGVRLCAEGPLFIRDDARAVTAGTVRADTVTTRLGDWTLPGRGARARFDVAATGQDVTASGGLKLASIDLPAGLSATRIEAAGRAQADGFAFRLSDALVAQTMDAPLIAPVRVRGGGLAGPVFRFDGSLETPGGLAFGDVAVRHEAGAGNAEVSVPTLRFAPNGLQPAALLPVLRGAVSEARGGAAGEARFAWTPDAPMASSGRLVLDDLSFRGPGLTVQRTEGLRGTVTLSSLMPVISEGSQALSVALIDLGAIKLPTGEARFALPGDGSLELIDAAFPWMGGQLSVSNATLRRGGGSDALLRLDDVGLAALAGFFEVDGLTAEGVIDGALPLVSDAFAIRVEGGTFASQGPGVVRYTGKAAAAAKSSQGGKVAFSALEELRFEKLSGTVSGPLDGDLVFGLNMEGTSRVDFGDARIGEPITAPVIYNLTLEAPILGLIDQARLTTDIGRQITEGTSGGPALPDRNDDKPAETP